jgi:hypothetical protein
VLLLLAVVVSGCSGRLALSSRRACEAAGGTYSGLTCYPNIPAGAEAMCMANGGVFLAGEDYCDIPIR